MSLPHPSPRKTASMPARFRLLRDLVVASLVLVAIASACVYAFSKLVPMLVTSPEADCCVQNSKTLNAN